jgi:ribonuclease HII
MSVCLDTFACSEISTSGLCGIDEAGRGPLAGPVVACAVIIPVDAEILEEITDSKKLSEKQREELYDFITDNYWYGIGRADHKEIDRINILQATFLAMKRALADLSKTARTTPRLCLIDGNKIIPGLTIKQKAIVKGDAKIKEISAASIVAKVTRDRLMVKYHKKYPKYNFAQHKGYGTPEHYAALEKNGASPIHRVTFLPERNLFGQYQKR